jgi:hypothetical protein
MGKGNNGTSLSRSAMSKQHQTEMPVCSPGLGILKHVECATTCVKNEILFRRHPLFHCALEHIQSGERRAFKDLEEIIFFITPYLGKTATRALRGHKFRRLLSDWKFPRKKRG